MQLFSRGSETRQGDTIRGVVKDELQQFAKTELREELAKACETLRQNLAKELVPTKNNHGELGAIQDEREEASKHQGYKSEEQVDSNLKWHSEASNVSQRPAFVSQNSGGSNQSNCSARGQRVQKASALEGHRDSNLSADSNHPGFELKDTFRRTSSFVTDRSSILSGRKKRAGGHHIGEVSFAVEDHSPPSPSSPSPLVLGEHQTHEDKLGPVGRRSESISRGSLPLIDGAETSAMTRKSALGKPRTIDGRGTLDFVGMSASPSDDLSNAGKGSSRRFKSSHPLTKVARMSTVSGSTRRATSLGGLKRMNLSFKTPTTKDLERNAKKTMRPLSFTAIQNAEMGALFKSFHTRSNLARAFISFCIFLNGIFIGLQTDRQARLVTDDMPVFYHAMEWAFCIIFTCELCINLHVHGCLLYTMPGRWWNMFDTFLVLTQLTDLWGSFVRGASSRRLDFSFVRVLRILRLLRVLRLIRLLRFVDELSVILNSIAYSAQSLCWTVLLLLFMMYVVGIMFCQIVFVHRVELEKDSDELKMWWGSLGLGVLSLYEAILGGIDWDTLIRPLMEEVSPMVGILFCLYIAFALLAVMNVITGTFVQSSLRDATSEQHKNFVAAARAAFAADDSVPSHEVFLSVISQTKFANWLVEMKIQPDQAMLLFSILQKEDRDGVVDAEQLVEGLARMGEGAKFMDIMKVMYEHYRFQEWAVTVEDGFNHLDRRFDQIAKDISSAVLTDTKEYLELQFGSMTDTLMGHRLSV